ncbi:MAG: acetyl-CoA carboxylase biotin carboxyl carrier protein [Lachnospiraceae bacterium]
MEVKDVKELIELVDHSDLTYFEFESLRMSKGDFPQGGEKNAEPVMTERKAQLSEPEMTGQDHQEHAQMVQAQDQTEEKKNEFVDCHVVTAPLVGTFYASAAPDKPPFKQKGDQVKRGDVLCIIEAMKLMNEVVSEYDGELVEVLVPNETLVEFGQPLFRIQ